MATYTTNYNMKMPGYSDTADINDINNNTDKIDTALQGLGEGIAIVSINNTHAAILAGQYVYVHGHSSLAEGLYIANNNISSNVNLSSSNLTAVSGGALNNMGRIKWIQTGNGSSFTLNIPSSSSHFLFIGTNNRATYAVLMVVTVNADAVQVTEISKGANVTLDNSVAGKLTVTLDANRVAEIYDMCVRGSNVSI